MASTVSTQSGPDAIVTVKVNFDGVTRRAKMHLREMVPRVLEDQIKAFLHIPANVETVIERYSDSAATYVLIEPGNMSVYKQLYRAAKAKSKLKLRVSTKVQAEKTVVPKPVSVEDDAEAESTPAPEMEHQPKNEALPTATNPSSVNLQTTLPFRSSSTFSLAQTSQPATVAPQPPASVSQVKPEAATASSSHQAKPHDPFQDLFRRSGELATKLAEMEGQRIRSSQLSGASSTPSLCPAHTQGATFAVCCNSCEKTIPNAHYHCSTCDDGDFDLCQSCVERGITCYSNDHWLIKRTMVNGQIVNSTTETIAPKRKVKKVSPAGFFIPEGCPTSKARAPGCRPQQPAYKSSDFIADWSKLPPLPTQAPIVPPHTFSQPTNLRTCNSCVKEMHAYNFLHCTSCEDFDLCTYCFVKGDHGHHPKHGFEAAVPGRQLPDSVMSKLAPGRNQEHHAICDGCDKYINGVRHKCLDCPDWDYCSGCVVNAKFIHPEHRFVPIYEPLYAQPSAAIQAIHLGICCDGPLCATGKAYPTYIRGIRYKCAVCHDLDFCANCEASPANEHNKTHPLIKFKTPVRHVSVTTTGEHQDGRRMPPMGDRQMKTAEAPAKPVSNSINPIQTVVDVKPVVPTPEREIKKEEAPIAPISAQSDHIDEKSTTLASTSPKSVSSEQDLRAVFLRDSVVDGTIFPPNHVFEQTWTLRNEGSVTWPAGCSVKFVGGDYMGHVDSAHPAGISELVSASESTVCYAPLAPGQEFSFTVLLRTPTRPGKIISYWRLTSPDGMKFGHRLWCEVNVRAAAASEIVPKVAQQDKEPLKTEPEAQSLMIFPKLEKESPVASIHEASTTEETKPEPQEHEQAESHEFEECVEDDEWEASDDGFMTDEEYDILDASDEEFLEEQEKKHAKK